MEVNDISMISIRVIETFTLAINIINSGRVEAKRTEDGIKMFEMRV